jgi:hypothetical protein
MEPETCPVCGHLVGDAQLATQWHQFNGDPQPIPQGGANDPGPMPEREQ